MGAVRHSQRTRMRVIEEFRRTGRVDLACAANGVDRTMHYDPLGVNDVLLQIGKDLDNKALPEPGQFLPSLDRVAADQHFIDIARDRARKLAALIRSTP